MKTLNLELYSESCHNKGNVIITRILNFTTLIPTNSLIQIKILLKIKESVPFRAHMLIM